MKGVWKVNSEYGLPTARKQRGVPVEKAAFKGRLPPPRGLLPVSRMVLPIVHSERLTH